MGYGPSDFVPSEINEELAVDVHAIVPDSELPGKSGHRIENLIALTRKQHIRFGDKKQWKSWLFKIHRNFLETNGIKYDKAFMSEQISKWEEYEKVL